MKKHLQYLVYFARHKWFVFLACCRLGIPIAGIVHDWTKALPREWFAYVNYFYGEHATRCAPLGSCALCVAATKAFDVAWNHHQKRNPHHWQYWLLTPDNGFTTALPMPDRYAREMVADWVGAGRAITGKYDVAFWYTSNKKRIVLHPDTRSQVEDMLRDSRVTMGVVIGGKVGNILELG